MKNGLAIWHYPHRTIAQNVRFFAKNGFEALSLNGNRFVSALQRGEGEEIASAVKESGTVLTVHYCLPRSHNENDVAAFYNGIDLIEDWNQKHRLISVLSFDVLQPIRDNIGAYIDYVMMHTEDCRVALEDFGLTPQERAQIAHLKGDPRFGYLVDIGHMYIRLCGKNQSGKALFTNRPDECPPTEKPDLAAFERAFASKEFPIFEIHLHNNDGVRDHHLFLEEGTLDVAVIARLLNNFEGILTIESAPGFEFECYGKDADDGILKTYEYWKKLINSEENN